MEERICYPKCHMYDGILHVAPKHDLEAIRQYSIYKDDVFIVSYPKSGSYWTRAVVAAILQVDDLANFERDGPGPNICAGPLDLYWEKNIRCQRPGVIMAHLHPHQLPASLKQVQPKIIWILRNPKDVIVSYYYFHRMNALLGSFKGSLNTFFEYFMKGELLYGSWFEHSKVWGEAARELDVFFLTYEKMRQHPHSTIKEISEFIGKPISAEQCEQIVRVTSFDEMRKNPNFNRANFKGYDQKEAEFIRKGEVGEWRRHLTAEQSERVDEAVAQHLGNLNLDIKYQ